MSVGVVIGLMFLAVIAYLFWRSKPGQGRRQPQGRQHTPSTLAATAEALEASALPGGSKRKRNDSARSTPNNAVDAVKADDTATSSKEPPKKERRKQGFADVLVRDIAEIGYNNGEGRSKKFPRPGSSH